MDGPFSPSNQPLLKTPLLMYAILLFSFGVAAYLFGVALVVPRYLLGLNAHLRAINEWIVWYSGIPVTLGVGLALVDVLALLSRKRPDEPIRFDPVIDRHVTVALTAYNDEASIGDAVRDFLGSPFVRSLTVISNNSSDNTMSVASDAGAIALNEPKQGYGHCVYRCLQEGLAVTEGAELIVLCEGDMTFRAADIEKLIAYAPHADIVNGTRTVEPLRAHTTSSAPLCFTGILFVGKLLESQASGSSHFDGRRHDLQIVSSRCA